ncbi:substrate-binding domain-containing protein [Alicyclobacillus vulcanalis]|uniref:Transcriptional regulator of molybdate metabolism, XRE family n=1 Tax=Alicyclobacillus vulcanalis TaxID=252246 RepID=A0A1N7KA46_9BACL|nr:substrate-binding domain-containing protein [Alicyclobacillus vulcanalis]SIS58465.1 transcriptional regulator of molybdate metabolism, XRE family [Alicyclobacillus vulcanalis]
MRMKFPNAVRPLRELAGLTRSELARRAGITPQALGLIEQGRVSPSTHVALRLAKALGTTVESLFDPEQNATAHPGTGVFGLERVALAEIAGARVARSLEDSAQPVPADGLRGEGERIDWVAPVGPEMARVFLSGCDPALSLLAAWVNRRCRECEAIHFLATNQSALAELERGTTHIASFHGTLEDIQAHASGKSWIIVPLAASRIGWVVPRHNPKRWMVDAGFREGRPRLVNRPRGAGARALVDEALRSEGVSPDEVPGYTLEAKTHQEVVRAVMFGGADVGVAHEAAVTEEVTFLPIRDEVTWLIIPRAHAEQPGVQRILDVLQSDRFRRDLAAYGPYDVVATGKMDHHLKQLT